MERKITADGRRYHRWLSSESFKMGGFDIEAWSTMHEQQSLMLLRKCVKVIGGSSCCMVSKHRSFLSKKGNLVQDLQHPTVCAKPIDEIF